MPPLRIVEGFVQIFADKSALDKTLQTLPGQMRAAGTEAGETFQRAFNAVTPRRAAGAGPPLQTLEGTRVGGSIVPEGASPFSRAGQTLNRARELRETAQAATATTRTLSLFTGGTKQAELAAIRLAGGLRIVAPEASTASLQILNLVRGFGVLGPAGLAVGAAIGVAAAAFSPFIARANAALESATKLAQLRSRGDFEGFKQIFEESADAMIRLGEAARASQDETVGFQGAANRIVGSLSLAKNAIAEFFGGGVRASQEQAKAAAQEAALLFQVLEKPKLDAQALREAAALTEREAGLAREAAQSLGDQERATALLVKAKRDQATADKALIDNEIARLNLERQRRPGGVGIDLDARIAAARQRQVDIDRRTAAEEEQIRRDAARSAGELRAREEEAQGRDLAFRRRYTEAVVGTARDLVEIEAQTNLTLEQAFRARTALQEEQTAQQIRAIEEESAARQAALRARIAGATGDERVALERELTESVREEQARRFEIETQAVAQRAQLAARERQERIAQAEQVFSIARTLNARRLSDDLATQAQIARAAREGSQIQIAALQRVAELQGQIQNQARNVISQALGVVQQQAQRLGIEGPGFVSRASLERDLARQRARDEQVRSRFQAGRSVSTEELQGALGNQAFFEQFEGLGGRIGDVFKQAVTPIREAFETTLGPEVTSQFDKLATSARDAFASLVTNVMPAFQGLERLVDETFTRIEQRVNAGQSQITASITRMVEENLTRALRDAERRS